MTMRFSEILKAICAKRVTVFNSIVRQEKYSSRDTLSLWDIVPWGHLRHMSSLATIESSLQATQLQQHAVYKKQNFLKN